MQFPVFLGIELARNSITVRIQVEPVRGGASIGEKLALRFIGIAEASADRGGLEPVAERGPVVGACAHGVGGLAGEGDDVGVHVLLRDRHGLGLNDHLSAQRSNGLRAMIERIREVAAAA